MTPREENEHFIFSEERDPKTNRNRNFLSLRLLLLLILLLLNCFRYFSAATRKFSEIFRSIVRDWILWMTVACERRNECQPKAFSRSANIGVFICLKCCGVHRSLGTHISKVLSVTLDDWSDDEIDSMVEVGGNSSANAIYEAFLPEGFVKPGPESSNDERKKFIRAKYELQEFLKPSLRITSGKSSLQSSLSSRIMGTFRSSDSSRKTEGMVEFIGLLKVKVIKGTNLAIRDMLSSDPYVVLTLGQQRVQTKVIQSNLNPVWNEDLMLSVPQSFRALKLQVFDHDTFSADDIMGEAEIDIQPMITSAMALGDSGLFGNIQIGKWLRSSDNALLEDSTVNIVDGKVKQEVGLKLQKVESGEVFLELEWMPLQQ